MSIIQLPHKAEPAPNATRERLLALVSNMDDDRLEAAEDMLAVIAVHQNSNTRGLTASEVAGFERFGVNEEALMQVSSLPATARSRVWEQQFSGHSWSAAEAAEQLGVTPARIRQRCTGGSLIAQRRSDGWHLPLFQFPDGRELPGWATVARAITAGTPLLLAERVLTSAAPRLTTHGEELAPLEWLAQGGDPALAAAAVDDALNRLL